VANTIRLNTDVVACMACNIYSSLTDLENSNVYEASLSSVFIWGDSIDQIQLKG
jgi:hypothetical protein